jgi:hypothetical protein
VRGRLAQRQVGLVAVALLAIAFSLALTARHGRKAAASLPPPQGSYSALVAASGAGAVGTRTVCGIVIAGRTTGIASPVLPCGVRVYLTYGSRHVLAPVIGRGPDRSGAEFAVTPALAGRLGLRGVKRVRWSYAGAG